MRASSSVLPSVCSGIVIVLNLLVFAGWQFDLEGLCTIAPNAPRVAPLTALMTLILAFSLVCCQSAITTSTKSWLTYACGTSAVLVVLLASWLLAKYFFGLAPSFELWLYPQKISSLNWYCPGRPAPHTAVSLVLLGLSIALSLFQGRISKNVALVFSLASTTISWVALFGYVSTIHAFYSLTSNPKTGIPLATALSLLLLCLGQMSLRPKEGVIGLLRSSSSGGLLFRTLLPVTFGVPLILSALVRFCSQAGLFEASFGLALILGVTSLLFSGFVVWIAFLLDQRDVERDQANKEREKLLAELEKSLSELKNLQHGFTTICSWSKQVLNEGQWVSFEDFLSQRFGINVTHGISEAALQKELGKFQKTSDSAP